jgi:D-glycero-alpha-D-manno-heptose-7-phosphate kinase
MIISRTPFRISLLGGGTDFPDWYMDHGGSVISTSINKFCYITCRYLPPFFDYKYRIRYYEREETKSIADIKHPSVRECLKFLEFNKGVDIVHHADLPAMSGLGSSSTFTVGLLNALYALQNKMVTKKELALNAIHVEQNLIKEVVGSQDQTIAAFGGFNRIDFQFNGIQVSPILCPEKRKVKIHSYMLLFFTGFSRIASQISKEHVNLMPRNTQSLREIQESVDEGMEIINSSQSPLCLGRLLNHQWMIKKSLTKNITNDSIDSIYNLGLKSGAVGGKLLGAGGGGFMLFIAPPEKHAQIKKSLKDFLYVPFNLDSTGSQIVYFSKENES